MSDPTPTSPSGADAAGPPASTDARPTRALDRAAWVVTVLVLVLVGMMRRIKIGLPDGVDLGFLPPLHAGLNALAAVALVVAFVAIKRRRIGLHRKATTTALALSALFLLSYVAYHFTTPETRYGDADGDGVVSEAEAEAVSGSRGLYLGLLLSHIALAAISLPLILFTYIRGFTDQVGAHRRLARWVFPLWLYVAVTGPVCYLMLRPYY